MFKKVKFAGLIFSLVLSMILPSVFTNFTYQTASAAYSPFAPKMGTTTSIKVFDLTKDMSYKSWGSVEAYMIETVIQGIVNRTSADKIYFTHGPQQHNFTPYPADADILTDGMIPVPRTSPTLDNTKTYPVLSYLLANYTLYIKGQVLIPDLTSPSFDKDAAIMAGITACGIEDAIPVTSAMSTYITGEGYSFTTKADTRSLSGTAAFNWAYANYFKPATSRKVIGTHSFTAFGTGPANQFPMMYDYFIANRAFVYSSNDATVLNTLLTTSNYPAGAFAFGITSDEGVISKILSRGYPFEFSNFPNMTVTSSFPSDGTLLGATAPAVTPATIDPNGAYISFNATDGDSLEFDVNYHYNQIRNAATKGTVPIGWTTSIFMNDLFPTMLQWRSHLPYADKYEYIDASTHEDLVSGSGYTPFLTWAQSVFANTNGMFRVINKDGEALNKSTYVNDMNPDLFINVYGEYTDGNLVGFKQVGANKVLTTNMSGATQGGVYSSTEIVNAIRTAVNSVPLGYPAFAVVTNGDTGNVDWTSAAVNTILANPQGRNYYFMRPRDMAAAFKKWAATPRVMEDFVNTVEDFTEVSDWNHSSNYNATITTDGSIATVTAGAANYYGNVGKTVSYNVDTYPNLTINVPTVGSGAQWAIKVDNGGGDIYIQPITSATGIFTYNVQSLTGWHGNQTFTIKLFPLNGSKYFKIDYVNAPFATNANVCDWITQNYNATITTDGSLATVTAGTADYYGDVGKSYTYNVDQYPNLTVSVPTVGSGAQWAIKVNNGSGPDKYIQVATSATGTFTYDLRNLTGWHGNQNLVLKLFPLNGSKFFKIDYIKATNGYAPFTEFEHVALKSQGNSNYVSANNAGAAMMANNTVPGSWETFIVHDLGNGQYAFLNAANNAYASANNAGAALKANQATVGVLETFPVYDLGNGNVVLQSTNFYVSANNAGAALMANQTTEGTWETFQKVYMH